MTILRVWILILLKKKKEKLHKIMNISIKPCINNISYQATITPTPPPKQIIIVANEAIWGVGNILLNVLVVAITIFFEKIYIFQKISPIM